MLLVLIAAGMSAFLTSKGLHVLGSNSMGIRYPISVILGYGVFVGVLGIWLSTIRRRARTHVDLPTVPEELVDAADTTVAATPVVDPTHDPLFDLRMVMQNRRENTVTPGVSLSVPTAGEGGGKSDGVSLGGIDIDADGVLVAIGVLVGIGILVALIGSLFILVEAPMLMAELIVDGVLVAGVAARFRPPSTQEWLSSAIGRTWKVAFAISVTFAIVGFGLDFLTPGATTMVESFTQAFSNSRRGRQ
jgi:hypothetical protein